MDEELQARIDKIWWWHNIDLKNGIVTPGHSHCEDQLSYLNIPDNLDGKMILDIGAWDGYFSFIAEDRGAQVVATDDINYSWGKVGTGKMGFDLAKEIRQSNVKDYESSIDELSPDDIGKFDIVFFFGVLYHMKNPYSALETIFNLTRDMAIVETASMMNGIKEPILNFYHNESPDPSNYFCPNALCLVEMLKAVGFREINITTEVPTINEEIRIAAHAYV